jgi:hypothetical protein
MRICKHHIGFFGDSIPFDSYLFLTLATSNVGNSFLAQIKLLDFLCSKPP